LGQIIPPEYFTLVFIVHIVRSARPLRGIDVAIPLDDAKQVGEQLKSENER